MGTTDSKNRDGMQSQQASLFEASVPACQDAALNLRSLFPEIIHNSEAMKEVLTMVAKVARSHSSVLILGESGTGKELIASAIHRLSPRSHKCFVAINCSAIPEDLLEAELFGHEKGAYTGADRKRIGHFGLADGGTVFLDEIGDMPLRLQAKLLRVLQERKFSPIGSREIKEIDIRIIAATNIDLEGAVKAQSFRLDLYYRLNVLPITLPPLKTRKDDISLLLEHFVNLSNRTHPHGDGCWLDDDIKAVLCRHDWPGNVRQLQNLVERLVIMSGGGRLSVSHLPSEFVQPASLELPGADLEADTGSLLTPRPREGASALPRLSPPSEQNWLGDLAGNFEGHLGTLPDAGINLTGFIEALENSLIVQALERTHNNKNQAAKLLGLNRTTLVERIKKRKILDLKLPSNEL